MDTVRWIIFALPYAVGNVVLTVLGPIIVACTFVG
jgi:putative transport protein